MGRWRHGWPRCSQPLAPRCSTPLGSLKAGAAAAKWCSLSELLQQSDIVSLHLPLTARSANLMNAETFRPDETGQYFHQHGSGRSWWTRPPSSMRCARAGCERPGLTCLPLSRWTAHNPLLALEQVVVTPHIAWLTPQTLERSLAVGLENCPPFARRRTTVTPRRVSDGGGDRREAP